MSVFDVAVEEITLRVGQLGSQRLLDLWPFAESPEIRTQYCIESLRLLISAMVRFAEQPCEIIKYPADWWQAVKERFAPAWALKRWPVEYTIWEPSVVYPKIALPKEPRYVTIRKLEFPPDWPPS